MNVGSGEILDSSPCSSICFGRILIEMVSFVLPGGTPKALRALDFFIFRVLQCLFAKLLRNKILVGPQSFRLGV